MPNSSIKTTALFNPYKFHWTLNAAFSSGNGVFSAAAPFDTKQFDTSSNVVSGVFTAPISGFYQFNWNIVLTLSAGVNEEPVSALYINGVRTSDSSVPNAENENGMHGSDIIQMTAGQTADIRIYNNVSRSLSVGNSHSNYFSGYLVSAT